MRGNSTGFTLVEVVIALFLMGLGVLAAAPMFMFAMQGNAVGGEKGAASALAVERMELLRSANFSTLTAGGSLTVSLTGYSDTSDPDFDVRWLIANRGTPTNTKTIRVRVVPAGTIPGPSRTVTLSTVRAP
jgi:prepilin-type N-terminal cleavage/methylation domain-containing protein